MVLPIHMSLPCYIVTEQRVIHRGGCGECPERNPLPHLLIRFGCASVMRLLSGFCAAMMYTGHGVWEVAAYAVLAVVCWESANYMGPHDGRGEQ